MTNQQLAPTARSNRGASVLALLALLGSTTALSAQSAVDTISDASRVRISALSLPRNRYITSVDSMRRDTLYFGIVPPIATRDVAWLEASLGKASYLQSAMRGASKGFMVGAVIGAVLITAGAIEDKRTPCDDCWVTNTGVAVALSGATLILTTSIGTVVGLVRRPERWVKVRLN